MRALGDAANGDGAHRSPNAGCSEKRPGEKTDRPGFWGGRDLPGVAGSARSTESIAGKVVGGTAPLAPPKPTAVGHTGTKARAAPESLVFSPPTHRRPKIRDGQIKSNGTGATSGRDCKQCGRGSPWRRCPSARLRVCRSSGRRARGVREATQCQLIVNGEPELTLLPPFRHFALRPVSRFGRCAASLG